jgi:hypothetical protein
MSPVGNGGLSRGARLVSECIPKIVGMDCRVDFFDPLSDVLINPADTGPPENECHRPASRARFQQCKSALEPSKTLPSLQHLF